MASFNKVILLGNLTRDPEMKYTPKGTAICNLGLAVNRVWVDDSGQKNEEVTFIDVELWGRTAEIAGEYLQKGRPVLIEGRLKLDTWDDKQTGQKRSKLRVVGETLQLLGGKPDAQQGEREERPAGRGRGEYANPPPARRPAPPQQRSSVPADDPDDDIPF